MIEVFTRKTGKDFAKVNWKERKKQLVRLFNSHWHNSSTVTGTNVRQSLARLFKSYWHDCSTVTGLIVQHWSDCSTVTVTIVQQSLAWLFNSHWHNCSTVTGTMAQQSLTRLVFFLFWQNSSTVMFTFEESCRVLGIQHMIRLKV